MGRIIPEIRKDHLTAEVNLDLVRVKLKEFNVIKDIKTLESGKKVYKTRAREELDELLIILFEKVIQPQLSAGQFRLDLSDKKLSQELEVKEWRAKKLRAAALERKLVFYPSWSRPKKPGDYPLFLVSREFLKFRVRESKKRSNSRKTYKPLYYKLYSQACSNVYRELEEMDIYLSVRSYMMLVWRELDELLESAGLTREDLRR